MAIYGGGGLSIEVGRVNPSAHYMWTLRLSTQFLAETRAINLQKIAKIFSYLVTTFPIFSQRSKFYTDSLLSLV